MKALGPRRRRGQWGWIVVLAPGEYEYERRLVMERKLGRKLLPNERVYHRNGDRYDNRPENLKLVVWPRPNLWIPCACGCGMRIRARGTDRRPRRYVHGHYIRICNPNPFTRTGKSSGSSTSDAGSGREVELRVRTGRGGLLPGYGSPPEIQRRKS